MDIWWCPPKPSNHYIPTLLHVFTTHKLEVVSDLTLFQTAASQAEASTCSSWLKRNKPDRFTPAQVYWFAKKRCTEKSKCIYSMYPLRQWLSFWPFFLMSTWLTSCWAIPVTGKQVTVAEENIANKRTYQVLNIHFHRRNKVHIHSSF